MTDARVAPSTGRGLLLVAGLLLGLALSPIALSTSWESAALGLGIGLAALVGLAQTCSA